MARLSGKLTAKSLGWDRVAIGAALKDKPASYRLNLGRIVGIVSGIRQTVNQNTGDIQNGLKGQFRGVSTLGDNGEPANDKNPGAVITAGVCYLPGGIQEMAEGTLASAQESDAKSTVQFGIDLFALPASNAAGYTFDADLLIEAEDTDPLDMLMQQATTAALAAPEAAKKGAEKPAE